MSSDEGKNIMRELNSIEPVAGSAWTGAWELDGTHTQTDEEGWAYAIDFWDLNRRQDRNISKDDPYGRA